MGWSDRWQMAWFIISCDSSLFLSGFFIPTVILLHSLPVVTRWRHAHPAKWTCMATERALSKRSDIHFSYLSRIGECARVDCCATTSRWIEGVRTQIEDASQHQLVKIKDQRSTNGNSLRVIRPMTGLFMNSCCASIARSGTWGEEDNSLDSSCSLVTEYRLPTWMYS